MANKSISELDSAVAVSNADLFETAVPDQESDTGYTSKKHSVGAVASHVVNDATYSGLHTTSQTIVGAINEVLSGSGGGAIDYVEYEITSLTNGTIDTSRGGCWYSKYGNIIHLHLSVKDLTAETTTSVFTMPSGLRPPHGLAMGIGIGAARENRASVSIGATSGVCNLWSESTTAVIDVEWTIDAQGGGGAGGNVHYSTTEHVVGTWIDGSVVYEKTVDTGALPNNTSNDIAHGISNLGLVLRLEGFAVRPSDDTKLTLPHVNNANLNNQIQVMVVGNYIRITTKIDRTNFTTSYVTIQYTKTA